MRIDEDNTHHDLHTMWAVCNTEIWDESRFYWRVEGKEFVDLQSQNNPPTFFDSYGEAKFIADRLGKFVARIHMNR